MTPTTSATKAQIPTARTGRVQPWRRMLKSRMAAAKIETTTSRSRAGRRACTSVYPAPFDIAVVRVDQPPALQDVAGRLGQRDQRQEDREMRLDGRAYPRDSPLRQDPAVEIVEDRRHDERDDQDGQRPVHDEVQERELEDVEPDVLAELRVLDTEIAAVAEEDPVLPFPDRARGGDEGHHDGQVRCRRVRRRAARSAGTGGRARPSATAPMSSLASRSQTTRLTHMTTKKMAPKTPKSPSFTTSSVENTLWYPTEENQRPSV